jgi:hypothetical protein
LRARARMFLDGVFRRLRALRRAACGTGRRRRRRSASRRTRKSSEEGAAGGRRRGITDAAGACGKAHASAQRSRARALARTHARTHTHARTLRTPRARSQRTHAPMQQQHTHTPFSPQKNTRCALLY